MHGTKRMRMVTVLALAIGATAWIAGCGGAAGGSGGADAAGAAPLPAAAMAATADAAPASPAPAAPAPPAGEVAITVNGVPIGMNALVDMMIADSGVRAAQQLIADALVQQAAAREGIEVTPEDVQREQQAVLSANLPPHTPEEEPAMLEQLLANQGVSREEWDAAMRRNAVLRTLAQRRATVTDQMLRDEFNRRYGEKVEVRHIQTASLSDAQAVLDLLDKGQEFAALAQQLSTNEESARDGGLIPPFSRETAEVPEAFRRAAFSLQEGQVSDVVLVDRNFHILRLERRIPPEGVTLDQVRGELEQIVRAELVQDLQVELMRELFNTARIEYVNPALRREMAAAARGRTGR